MSISWEEETAAVGGTSGDTAWVRPTYVHNLVLTRRSFTTAWEKVRICWIQNNNVNVYNIGIIMSLSFFMMHEIYRNRRVWCGLLNAGREKKRACCGFIPANQTYKCVLYYSVQRVDRVELQQWSCTRRTRGTFYGGSWGTNSLSYVASIFLLMLHCLVCQEYVSQLWPFQGFLYVFGGMLDSAYTKLRCPLWVFDIGEFYCGGASTINTGSQY